MASMSGKVVLVTGGSSGIGQAAAEAFAAEGARVVLAARGVERGEATAASIRASGGTADFVAADVSRGEDVERLVAAVVARHGRLDAAFNNAATEAGAFALTADFTETQFDEAIAQNLRSVWLCMKHEIAQMLRQSPSGGAIVNTSSVNGLGGVATGSLYSAAKAGVHALTKSAAQEYATSGMRVNALVAGAFRTPMLERVFERAGGGAGGAAAVEQAYAQMIPLRRVGAASEAAAAALWLCSDAASYVTGHTMIVDGGMSASMR